MVIIVIGFFLNEDAREDILKELYKSQPNSSESVESPKSTLKQDEDEVRAWQARLQAKKAQLSPTDAAGKAAFDAELKQYMEKLEAVKRARVAAGVK